MTELKIRPVEDTRRAALEWEYDHSGNEAEEYQEQVALRRGEIARMEREIEELESLMAHVHEFAKGTCLVCGGVQAKICMDCHLDRFGKNTPHTQ